MSENVSASLGIELGADGAIRESVVLKDNLNKLVTAEDAVLAASKAITEAFKAQTEQARADAAAARVQEQARRESANAAKISATAVIAAEREKAQAQKDSVRLAAQQERASKDAQRAAQTRAQAEVSAYDMAAKMAVRAAAQEARAAKDVERALKAKADAEERSAREAIESAAAEKRAAQALEQRTRAMALQHGEALKLNASFDKQQQSANGLSGAFGKLAIAAAAYKALEYAKKGIALADTYTNMQSRLGLVTNGTENLKDVQEQLANVSQKSRSALESNVQLYASLARSTKTLGLSQKDLVTVTQAVGQSFLISGASASETSAAVRQLSQALASGVLRGDEFNSIAENAPRLQQAVAESLGVTIGQLRAMAAEGKITGAVVTKALIDSSKAIDQEASRISATVGGSMQQVKNSLLLAVGEFDKAAGATRSLSTALTELSSATDASGKKTVSAAKEWGLFAAAAVSVGKALAAGLNGPNTLNFADDAKKAKTFADALDDARDAINKYRDARKGIVAEAATLGKVDYQTAAPFPGMGAKPGAGADKVTDEYKKLQEQYAKTAAAAQLELDKQTELTAAYGKGARAIEDINDAYALKAKLATVDKDLSNAQKARMVEFIVNTNSQAAALKELTRAEEDRLKVYAAISALRPVVTKSNENKETEARLLEAAAESWKRYGNAKVVASKEATNVALGRTLREEAEDWANTLLDVSGIVGTIGEKFRSVVDEARAVAGLIGDSANAIKSISDASKSGASTTSKVSAGGDVIGVIVGVVNLAVGIGKKVDSIVNKDEREAREFANAVKQFSSSVDVWRRGFVNAATLGTAQLQNAGLRDAIGAQFVNAQRVTGRSESVGVSLSASQLDVYIKQSEALQGRLKGDELKSLQNFIAMLKIVAVSARAAEEALKKEQQSALKRSDEDLSVRKLAAQGNSDAAASRRLEIEQQRELADAIKNTKDVLGADSYIEHLKEVQKIEKEVADAARAERTGRSVFDINTSTRAFGDPRGASQAAFDEGFKRQIADAGTAAEKAALSLNYVAASADRVAQLALKDATDSANFTSRILNARGDTRQGEDIARASNNANEFDQAFRGGASDANLGLLLKAQFAEGSNVQMVRAIEDGTKAINAQRAEQLKAADENIRTLQADLASSNDGFDRQIENATKQHAEDQQKFDAQIDAAREGTKAQLAALDVQIESARSAQQYAQEQLQLAQQQVDATKRVVEGLQSFEDSMKLGDLSTLSPTAKLEEARRQREELAAKAFGGDKDAAIAVTGAIRASLEQSRNVNASGLGFVADSTRGQEIIDKLQGQFGGQLGREQGALSGAQGAAAAQAGLIESLEKQRANVSELGEKQVAGIQALKEQSALDFEKNISAINLFKDAAAAGLEGQIKAAQEGRDGINAFHDAAIQKLIEFETSANQDRIDRYERATPVTVQTPVTMTPDGFAITAEIAALRAEIAALKTLTNTVITNTGRAADVTETTGNRVVNAVGSVQTAVIETGDNTRRALTNQSPQFS